MLRPPAARFTLTAAAMQFDSPELEQVRADSCPAAQALYLRQGPLGWRQCDATARDASPTCRRSRRQQTAANSRMRGVGAPASPQLLLVLFLHPQAFQLRRNQHLMRQDRTWAFFWMAFAAAHIGKVRCSGNDVGVS